MRHFQDKSPSWGVLDQHGQTLVGRGGRAWIFPTRREAQEVIDLYSPDGRYKPVKLTVRYEFYRSREE